MNQSTRSRAVAVKLRRALFPLVLGLVPALGGCNERPSDLREWRASDHDRSDASPAQQGQVDPAAAPSATPGLEDVTIVAWSQNCTQCHGQLGRGDGPRGPMLKATNLSDPTWQSSVTDEQIGASIKLGRGAMPSFKQLPDATIAKLVKLVRMMNLTRIQAAASAAPAGSAAAGAASGKATATASPSAAAGTPQGAPSAAPRSAPSAAPASNAH